MLLAVSCLKLQKIAAAIVSSGQMAIIRNNTSSFHGNISDNLHVNQAAGDTIAYTSLTVLLLFWIIPSNSALIVVLLKYPVTTLPNVIIRVSLAIGDILGSILTLILLIYIFFSPYFSHNLCGIFTDLIIATVYFAFIITSSLAIERYFFFVRPLRYGVILKPKVLIFSLISLYIALVFYLIVVGQIKGHELLSSALSHNFACHNQSVCSNFYSFAYNCCCIAALLKVKKLQTAFVAPQNRLAHQKTTKAIKLIL